MLDDLLKIPGVKLNGPSIDENRLNGNINITIDGVDSSVLLGLCDMHDICISKGSACHSYSKIPSSTLKAIGLTDEQASQTIRITIDMFNTYEEVLKAVKTITWLINDIKHS
jgi:cysteine desulfurase